MRGATSFAVVAMNGRAAVGESSGASQMSPRVAGSSWRNARYPRGGPTETSNNVVFDRSRGSGPPLAFQGNQFTRVTALRGLALSVARYAIFLPSALHPPGRTPVKLLVSRASVRGPIS